MYTIRYSNPMPYAAALQAETAKRAIEIARELAARGEKPIIEKDGTTYSLKQLEVFVAGVKVGSV